MKRIKTFTKVPTDKNKHPTLNEEVSAPAVRRHTSVKSRKNRRSNSIVKKKKEARAQVCAT